MNIEKLLNAIGKQIFIKYYYYFKDLNYSSTDIMNIIKEKYTNKSKRSRIGHARMIFNYGLNIEALKIIAKSKVSEDTVNRAKNILNQENMLDSPELNQLTDILKFIIPDEYKKIEEYILSKIRIGQSDLRKILLSNKEGCEICGIKNKELLITSHIKPWAKSNKNEKLDCDNVLLLCSNHDALFDKGLISFNNDGSIIISNLLNDEDRNLLHLTGKEKITVNSKNKVKYLEYHRENIFKQNHINISAT